MPSRSNVASLCNYRHRDSQVLIDYLSARLEMGDLCGLVVQSIGRDGVERVHMTGIYDADRAKSAAAALALSIKMTAAQGGFGNGGV